jgi:hypothetical protein
MTASIASARMEPRWRPWLFSSPSSEDEMLSQVQFLGQRLEMMPVHQTRAQDGQPTLGQLRETAVKLGRHRKLEHRIAQEFEALVVRQPLPFSWPKEAWVSAWRSRSSSAKEWPRRC